MMQSSGSSFSADWLALWQSAAAGEAAQSAALRLATCLAFLQRESQAAVWPMAAHARRAR